MSEMFLCSLVCQDVYSNLQPVWKKGIEKFRDCQCTEIPIGYLTVNIQGVLESSKLTTVDMRIY
jgi:hypothetical protein